MHEVLAFLVDELRSMWRFRWVAVGLAWIICMCGWIYVLRLPDVYSAEARLYVRARSELSGVGTQQDVGAQLTYLSNILQSQSQMERIAERLGLVEPGMDDRRLQGLAGWVRSRYSISYVGQGGRGSQDGLFNVRFVDQDREMAQRAVQVFLDTLSERYVGEVQASGLSTQTFLDEQIAEYEKRLRDDETRLAEFKRKNIGVMPGEGGDYFTRIQRETAALNDLRSQLTVQQSLRDELSRQLSSSSTLSTESDLGAIGMMADTETARRLAEAKAKLDELLLRFTDRHPDVIAARETITQLEMRRRAELSTLATAGSQLGTVQSSSPVVQSLQIRLNDANASLAGLRSQVNDAERRLEALQAALNRVPEVEAEFAQLNRDYDVNRSQYQDLLKRREQARVGQEAQESGSVRFDVVDPPRATFSPVGPNRLRFYTTVLIAGLMCGLGLAFGLHKFRPVFNNPSSLASVTGLPVLGQVSMAWLGRHRNRMRLGLVTVGAATGLLFVAFAAVVMFSDRATGLVRQLLT
jgi:polysaccharide chain length determinant protein (PEP-CTERM system associated)